MADGSVLAELARSLIQERTKAGREAAKRRGLKLGRKRELIKDGESPKQIAHLLGVARSTRYAARYDYTEIVFSIVENHPLRMSRRYWPFCSRSNLGREKR